MGDESNISPLTTEQIRESAGRWTLAGDVGLLGHLQNFSQDVIRRAEATESLLSNLSEQVEATSTRFNNVSNQFLSLQNSQFLENRVYEDDSPTEDIKPKPLGSEEVESQQVTIGRYKEAVSSGLSLLDSHFDRVELLESSDEEEEEPVGSNPTLVFRPKAVYAKPLPLLIGSAEWWADDNVGLGEYQENDDSERQMSASESEGETQNKEPNLQKRVRLSPSSSSSTSEATAPPKRPPIPAELAILPSDPANLLVSPPEDLFEDPDGLFKPSGDIFDSGEDADLFGSIQKTPLAKNDKKILDRRVDEASSSGANNEGLVDDTRGVVRVSNNFTRELASKLSSVSKTQDSLEPAKAGQKPKTLPQEKPPAVPSAGRKAYSKGLFDDDDNNEDSLFGRGTGKNSPRLFDDSPKKTSNIWNKSSGDLFGDPSSVKPSASHVDQNFTTNVVGGVRNSEVDKPSGVFFYHGPPPLGKPSLFEDDDSEVDDLFGRPSKSTSGPSRGLFDAVDLFSNDVDDDLFSVKKPLPVDKKESVISPSLKEPSTSSYTPPQQLPSDKFFTPSDLGSDKSGGGPVAPVRWSSTPAVVTTPNSAVSCSISDVQETPSSLFEVQEEESRDRGFIEDSSTSSETERNTSDLGKDSSDYKHSPVTWFQPEMSSTSKTIETTGYNTAGYLGSLSNAPGVSPIDQPMPSTIRESNEDDTDLFGREQGSSLGVKSRNSSNRLLSRTVDRQSTTGSGDLFSGISKMSLPPQPIPRNTKPSAQPSVSSPAKTAPSLIPQDDDGLLTKSGMSSVKAVSNAQLPTVAAKMGRSQGVHLPPSADDSDDDLFAEPFKNSISKTGRSIGNSNNLVPDDDLFGASKLSSLDNKSKGLPTRPAKTVSIFDDDNDEGDGLFSGGAVKKEDTVSVSSSRSSIFEEGKSNLPGIFGKEVLPKAQRKVPSLFDDIDDDCDLFSQSSKKTDDDLFSTSKKLTAADTKKVNAGFLDESSKLGLASKLSPKVYPTKPSEVAPFIASRKQQDSLFPDSSEEDSLFCTANAALATNEKAPDTFLETNVPSASEVSQSSTTRNAPNLKGNDVKPTASEEDILSGSSSPSVGKILDTEIDGKTDKKGNVLSTGLSEEDFLFGSADAINTSSTVVAAGAVQPLLIPKTDDFSEVKKPEDLSEGDNSVVLSKELPTDKRHNMAFPISLEDNSLFVPPSDKNLSSDFVQTRIQQQFPELKNENLDVKEEVDACKDSHSLRQEPGAENKQSVVFPELSEEGSLFGSSDTEPKLFVKSSELKNRSPLFIEKNEVTANKSEDASTLRKDLSAKPDNNTGKQNFVFPELSEEDALFGIPSPIDISKKSHPSRRHKPSEKKLESNETAISSGNLNSVESPIRETGNTKIHSKSSVTHSDAAFGDEFSAVEDRAFGTEPKVNLPAKVGVKITKKVATSTNIFADCLSDDEDDLFGGRSSKKPPDKPKDPEGDLPSNDSNALLNRLQPVPLKSNACFENKRPLQAVPTKDSPPPSVKLKPPSSLNIIKPADIFGESKDEKDGEVVKTAVPKKVGKLNIPSNLKINPAALMPGAKLVKSVLPQVSVTGEQPGKKEALTSPVDLSQPPTSEGILASTGKDRIKIQVKRRPQTRKARQEALRTSGIDFTIDQPESPPRSVSEKDSGSSSSAFQTVDSSPSPAFTSNPYTPSTDGEDYFNVPELCDQSEKDDHIFSGNIRQHEPLLFHGAPVISPSQEANSVGQLQNEATASDDLFTNPLPNAQNIPRQISEGDLFSSHVGTSPKERSPSPNPLFLKVKPKPQPIVKPAAKSLFDDDEDIDIFSGSVQPPKAENKRQEKPECLSTDSETFVDPLGLLKGSDD